MNSSSSANATISSIASRTRARERPWIEPFRKTFSRPVKSAWKPAPSSSSDATRPPVAMRPVVGFTICEIRRSRVVLPEPFRPTSPTASPGATCSETSRSAQTSRAPEPAARRRPGPSAFAEPSGRHGSAATRGRRGSVRPRRHARAHGSASRPAPRAASAVSGSVRGRTPWPRLKMCPGRPPARCSTSRAARSTCSHGPSRAAGSRLP